jgi:S-DNA-T family DNA segregation ATPase FtsK/SpoIIIE
MTPNGGATGLALVLMDPKGAAFRPFAELPHLARPVIHDVDEAREALGSLVRLMERRGAGGASTSNGRSELYASPSSAPGVAVFIDELADLLMTGGKQLQHSLTRLTQRGRESGIHIIAATQKPTSAVLGPLIKANFPVRLVGRVTSAEDARTATGWSGTGAERLMGRGDFLAVAEGCVRRFQVAHVSPTEIRETVRQLARGHALFDHRVRGRPQRISLPWTAKQLSETFS